MTPLCTKWNEQTNLMDSIPEEFKEEFALVLEKKANELLDAYSGKSRKHVANVWPGVINNFRQQKGLPLL